MQWVGIEVTHAGKLKLGDRKDVWHMQEMKGWEAGKARDGTGRRLRSSGQLG